MAERRALAAATVAASLFRRQHLHPAARTSDVTALTSDILALHSTDPATVHLSVWTRSDYPTLEATHAALRSALVDGRTLVRIQAMRRTLFVVPSAELGWFRSAFGERLGTGERRRCARLLVAAGLCDEGSADELFASLSERVCQALEGGPHSVPELARRVPELAARIDYKPDKPYGGPMSIGNFLADGMGVLGQLVRGPTLGGWRSGQCAWARLDRWLPEAAAWTVDPAEARAAIVRRYLDVFGPVTREDAVWWTGFTKRQVDRALEQVEGVTPVTIRGWEGEHLVLAEGLDEMRKAAVRKAPAVALLPALDPYVMGYKRRERFLDPAWTGLLFDRNGNAGPTVFVDGRGVGGWAQRADGEIVAELLAPVSARVSRAVAAEARRLEQALGEERVKPRFPSPLVKRLAR